MEWLLSGAGHGRDERGRCQGLGMGGHGRDGRPVLVFRDEKNSVDCGDGCATM